MAVTFNFYQEEGADLEQKCQEEVGDKYYTPEEERIPQLLRGHANTLSAKGWKTIIHSEREMQGDFVRLKKIHLRILSHILLNMVRGTCLCPVMVIVSRTIKYWVCLPALYGTHPF